MILLQNQWIEGFPMTLQKRTKQNNKFNPNSNLNRWEWWLSQGIKDTPEARNIFLQKKKNWMLELFVLLPEETEETEQETQNHQDHERNSLILDIEEIQSFLFHKNIHYPGIDEIENKSTEELKVYFDVLKQHQGIEPEETR